MGDVVGIEEAREARDERRDQLRRDHPAAKFLAHVLDDHAHRRTADGELACGAPPGALIAAPKGTPLCEECFPT